MVKGKSTVNFVGISGPKTNVAELAPFDWEGWAAKYKKKEQPYEVKDARPQYDNLARFAECAQAGATSRAVYGQPRLGLEGYRPDAISDYRTLFQDSKSN